MAVTAYVLIQTEVGKAANVARAVQQVDGVVSAEDVTGPYDVIVRAEAATVDDLGSDGGGPDPAHRGHHPHGDLPRGQPLSALDRPGGRRPAGPAAVSRWRQLERSAATRSSVTPQSASASSA